MRFVQARLRYGPRGECCETPQILWGGVVCATCLIGARVGRKSFPNARCCFAFRLWHFGFAIALRFACCDVEMDTARRSTPLVSWLLCAHELSPALHDTIESCFRQTFPDFELLFVANGPRADSVAREVRRSFGADARLRVCVTQMRYLTFSLNLGVSIAKGAYIARIDADDISEVYRLERQLVMMELDPTIAVLGTGYRFIDGTGNPAGVVVPPQADSKIRGALFYSNPMCHPSTLLRRDAVIEVGGYGGGRYAQDYHLWVQFALKGGWTLRNIPDLCVRYRIIGGGARGTRRAYASVAASRVEGLCRSGDPRWLLGAVLSGMRAVSARR